MVRPTASPSKTEAVRAAAAAAHGADHGQCRSGTQCMPALRKPACCWLTGRGETHLVVGGGLALGCRRPVAAGGGGQRALAMLINELWGVGSGQSLPGAAKRFLRGMGARGGAEGEGAGREVRGPSHEHSVRRGGGWRSTLDPEVHLRRGSFSGNHQNHPRHRHRRGTLTSASRAGASHSSSVKSSVSSARVSSRLRSSRSSLPSQDTEKVKSMGTWASPKPSAAPPARPCCIHAGSGWRVGGSPQHPRACGSA